MKLRDIISTIDVISMAAPPETEISDICFDSRRASPGAVFVAVEGFETDGHKYISSALERGAAAVICQKKPETDCPYVLVRDSRLALAQASAEFFGRPSRSLRVIGVTGTNGKTSVTFILKSLLERTLGVKVGLMGTIRNMIGDETVPSERTTPESCDIQRLLAEMRDRGCAFAVMEVSSHALALDRVADVEFCLGVFTNLTQDHLDFHGTMESYLAAKSLLFRQCKKGLLNLDDGAYPVLRDYASCPLVTYSLLSEGGDYRAKNVRLKADGVEFQAVTPFGSGRAEAPIPGGFTVYNVLAALACACELGVPSEDALCALREVRGVPGRMEVVPGPKDFTVLIDYAHTPDAIKNVLTSVRGFAGGRTVIVFGCGGDRDRTKRPIMGAIAAELADFLIVTSDNPRTEEPEAIIGDILEGIKDSKTPKAVITDRREAIAFAIEHAQRGDVIILAGKGHEDYQIIGREKTHLDEREVAASVFRRLGL